MRHDTLPRPAPPAAPAPTGAAQPSKHLTLLLLALTGLMLILDLTITNVALPSIQRALRMTPQGLQWVVNAYALGYGGFLLLGGRLADRLGRRRVFLAGVAVFTLASLVGGLAPSAGVLVAARGLQGLGAALAGPASLSIITTAFAEGPERNRALGVWSAVLASGGAIGMLAGGLLTQYASWRWVLFVNVPFSAIAFAGAFALLKKERRAPRLSNFDALGGLLVTGGMLLLVYALVKAPEVGWGTTRTIGELAAAAATLAAFVANELRVANPLVPLSILRVKGVAAADGTQMVMVAGLLPMFFFLTLYMQTVLHYSPIQTGTAYLPFTGGVIIVAGISSQLFARIGTKPFIVAGSLIGAGGLYWLSRIPVHGSYTSDILPGLLVVAFGLGAVFVGATTAANAGIGEDKAGLAAGLLNSGQQLGGALGLAILSALATAHTNALLHAGHDSIAQAATHGYQRALMAGAGFALAAAAVALLAPNARQTTPVVEEEPALDLAA